MKKYACAKIVGIVGALNKKTALKINSKLFYIF